MSTANVIKQLLTKTPCSATIDTNLHMGSCIPQENPNRVIVWKEPHHNTLRIHEIQKQGSYILIPSLHGGESIQKKFGPTRGIVQLGNGLAIRHVEVIKSSLQGLLDTVTKYDKTVSDDAVAPMLEAHIVLALFLQKQTMTCKWERLCFIQKILYSYKNGWLVFSPLMLPTLSINDQVLKWKQWAMH